MAGIFGTHQQTQKIQGMTKVSYIAGPVPSNEIADRSQGLPAAPIYNPLVMSDGEFYLRLMGDQVSVLASYFPEKPLYRKGMAMIENALHKGIHGYTMPIGSIEPTLYPIARAIEVYKLRNRVPAVMATPSSPRVGSWENQSLVAGPIPEVEDMAKWWWMNDKAYLPRIGVTSEAQLREIIQNQFKDKFGRELDFVKSRWLGTWSAEYALQKEIVSLYNSNLEKFAHHPLYSFLPQTNAYPAAVVTKNILHSAGLQTMAKVGKFSQENMTLWTRNSILRANIGGNVGAVSPELSAFMLSGLPESRFGEFLGTSASGGSGTKWDKSSIGAFPIVALLGVIGAAVSGAFAFLTAVQQRETAAFASVQGWGTPAFAAAQQDWQGYDQQPTEKTSGLSLPIIAAAGMGLWLIFSDDGKGKKTKK